MPGVALFLQLLRLDPSEPTAQRQQRVSEQFSALPQAQLLPLLNPIFLTQFA